MTELGSMLPAPCTSDMAYPCNTTSINVVSLSLACSGLALLMAIFLTKKLRSYERGTPEMNKLCDKIKSGARAFLVTEYKYLTMFVFLVFAVLVIIYTLDPPSNLLSLADNPDRLDGIRAGGCFIGGALLSASAGWAGMSVATDANVRTTQAADKQGLSVALRVAFTGGAVMGFTVVGLGLAGLSFFFWLMTLNRSVGDLGGSEHAAARSLIAAVDSLASFGFGASSIALFARVAGGIYTKAADVGADLVGKVEMDIPEDDPRNPAVIADNVGDNVGDVAGMGADLFESFVGSIIAAATLANGNAVKVALPFWIAGAGIVASLFGFFAVSTKDGANQRQLMFALHKGVISSSVLVLAFSAVIVSQFFPGDQSAEGWKIFACIAIGLIAGILIGQATEYYTSYSFWPTQSITQAGVTGP